MATKYKTTTGTFVHGMKIGDTRHKEFVLREATTKDMFEAEKETPAENPLAFNGSMMCRQLVSVGDYEGPFTLSMISDLKPVDYGMLRKAQLEVEALGEDEAGSDASS